MKTEICMINHIALMLIFGLLMITTYAQDKQQSKSNPDNIPTRQ